MSFKQGQELPIIRKTVTQEQLNRYAQATGDENPLHLDEKFAAKGPFGRIVGHGMLTLAFVSEMLTHAFGRDWLENGRMKVRFRAPVYPGESVATYGALTALTEEDNGLVVRCAVGCRKADGQDVITGEASVNISPGRLV